MPSCKICGINNDKVKKVKVIIKSVYDNNFRPLVAGSNSTSSSILLKDESEYIEYFICEQCATNVFGLYTEDADFPYDNFEHDKSVPAFFSPVYFYDIYLNKFFCNSTSLATPFVTYSDFIYVYTTFSSTFYYPQNRIINLYNFHNGYTRCWPANHDVDEFRCSYEESTYDNTAVVELPSGSLVSIDAFIKTYKCSACGKYFSLVDLKKDDQDYFICDICYKMSIIQDELKDSVKPIEYTSCSFVKESYDNCLKYIDSVNVKQDPKVNTFFTVNSFIAASNRWVASPVIDLQ